MVAFHLYTFRHSQKKVVLQQLRGSARVELFDFDANKRSLTHGSTHLVQVPPLSGGGHPLGKCQDSEHRVPLPALSRP